MTAIYWKIALHCYIVDCWQLGPSSGIQAKFLGLGQTYRDRLACFAHTHLILLHLVFWKIGPLWPAW